MVLSILVAIIAAPALLGTQEAIRQSQSKEKKEEHRARRCNLIVTCVKSSMRSREIDGRQVVLRNGKLYIDTGTDDGSAFGHPYAGYYLPYPDVEYEGLVTTITDEAPVMNWVYVDKDTYEVKYGVRLDAQPNLTGPFDCTRQDRRLTFSGWEGWCAVEEHPNIWALYFDKDDDGLRSKVAPGYRILEVELARKEKRWKMDNTERQQDQTTKRAVDVKADAPVDAPITQQASLDPPGVRMTPTSPLKMPASIFLQKPQPEAPLPPKTPPPAYTPSLDPEPLPPLNLTPPTTNSTTLQSKRSTPKLNRNSGTRALAQAQKFEALAQTSNGNANSRDGSPASRPTSNTDVASNGGDLRLSADSILQMYSERPDSSTLAPKTPVPTSVPPRRPAQPLTVVSPKSDPAIFAAYTEDASAKPAQRSKSSSETDANSESRLRRKSSFRRDADSNVPKAPLPPLPPLPSNSRPNMPSRDRERVSNSPDRRRLPASVERAPSERRRPGASMPDESSRSTPRAPPNRSSPPLSRRRGDPASSQREEVSLSNLRTARRPPNQSSSTQPSSRQRSDSNSSQNSNASKTNPRSLSRAATINSMGTTMTTGARNRGMASRLGSQTDDVRQERTRTNSSLYREIDDILQPSRGRSGTAETVPGSGSSSQALNATSSISSSARAPAARNRRPPPLRRAATSTTALRRGNSDGSPTKGDVGSRMGEARRRNRESGEGI